MPLQNLRGVITMPLISVIMPVYNCEKYIRQAVASILNQTFKDFELIIIDDGSTDKTAQSIYMADMDPRIELIRHLHAGIIYQLNFALRRARGKYIARHDGDDYSHPLRFEKQVKALEDQRGDIIATDMLLVNEDDIPYLFMTYPRFPGYEDLMEKCCVPHPTVMFRREVYEKIGGYDEEFDQNCCEDYDFWLRAAKHFSFYTIPQVLYTKREHPAQSVQVNKHKIRAYDVLARAKAMVREITDG